MDRSRILSVVSEALGAITPRTRRWMAIILGAACLSVALNPVVSFISYLNGNAAPSLPFVRPVVVAVLDRDALISRWEEEVRGDINSERQCQRLALYGIGLASNPETVISAPETPQVSGLFRKMTRLATPLPAFYAQGSDTVFVGDATDAAIAHEKIHALDDQHSDRMERGVSAEYTDERIALRAVAEGTAVAFTGSSPLRVAYSHDFDRTATAFAYGRGAEYVAWISGESLEVALSLSPRSAYEVMFEGEPLGFPVDEEELLAVAGLSAEDLGEFACVDRVGVLGLVVAQHSAGASDQALALSYAGGWVDDRLVRVLGEAGERFYWIIRFQNERVARDWMTAAGIPLMLENPSLKVLPSWSAAGVEGEDDSERALLRGIRNRDH